MQRLWIGVGVGALLVGALTWMERAPARVGEPPHALGAPVAVRALPAPVEPARAPAAEPPGALPPPRELGKKPSTPAAADASAVENDLRALEDQALRQIDVTPLLRAAGIDPEALAARPDGNDALRHVAADELMTRSIMRDTFTNTIYPYGYPRERALSDARAAADRMVASLTPEARVALLESALGDGSSAEPEPSFYGPDSGRVFAEGERVESPPD